ncbi:MAG: exosortase/archaeosortase family protein [Candidatus Micrarchaeota archaeon]|nr:exosortase/archaeosortase family protein [Candidatus Micrarchaeota archaeon]
MPKGKSRSAKKQARRPKHTNARVARPPKNATSASALPKKTTLAGFLLRMAAFFGVPYLLLHIVPLDPLLDAIAAIESALLKAAGVASTQFGAVLSSNAAWFQIVPDCSGLVMVFLLAGLLWSTPVKRPKRVFIVFAPLLLAWNLVRLFLVLYAGGVLGQTVQDVLHVGLWFVDAGIVLGIWWMAFSKAR